MHWCLRAWQPQQILSQTQVPALGNRRRNWNFVLYPVQSRARKGRRGFIAELVSGLYFSPGKSWCLVPVRYPSDWVQSRSISLPSNASPTNEAFLTGSVSVQTYDLTPWLAFTSVETGLSSRWPFHHQPPSSSRPPWLLPMPSTSRPLHFSAWL